MVLSQLGFLLLCACLRPARARLLLDSPPECQGDDGSSPRPGWSFEQCLVALPAYSGPAGRWPPALLHVSPLD